MDWATLATPAAVFLAFGLTAWFIHRRFDRYENRLDRFEKAHQTCQLSIAKDYATRAEVDELWQRTGQHAERLARLEAREDLP